MRGTDRRRLQELEARPQPDPDVPPSAGQVRMAGYMLLACVSQKLRRPERAMEWTELRGMARQLSASDPEWLAKMEAEMGENNRRSAAATLARLRALIEEEEENEA